MSVPLPPRTQASIAHADLRVAVVCDHGSLDAHEVIVGGEYNDEKRPPRKAKEGLAQLLLDQRPPIRFGDQSREPSSERLRLSAVVDPFARDLEGSFGVHGRVSGILCRRPGRM